MPRRRLRHLPVRRLRVAANDLAFGAFQRGNYITAFSLATQRAADKDDPKSMTLLGELYANGLGVPQNDKKAEDWYKLAAARGDANAMFALGMFRMQTRRRAGSCRSAKWLAAAAKLGHPIAAYDLALLYMEGELFPRDFGRAAQLLSISAQAGNPRPNMLSAPSIRRDAACQGHARSGTAVRARRAGDETDAEVEYAIDLFNGDGVTRNQPMAAALFRKAALRATPSPRIASPSSLPTASA